MFPTAAALWAASLLAPTLTLADLATDLAAALVGYPALTTFASFTTTHPALLNALLAPGATVLAPSNQAFADYPRRSNGTAFAALSDAALAAVLAYHVLDAPLSSVNFSSPRGLTVPTRLVPREWNNRDDSPRLKEVFGDGAVGQVVFAQRQLGGGRRRREEKRLDQGVELSGGLSTVVLMTTLDIKFAGGSFVQMVDAIMTLPDLCSETMGTQPTVEKLEDALYKTKVYDQIDLSANVTCLAPNNDAFDKTGKKPPDAWNVSAIDQLVLSHVFPQVLYSDLMEDGLELTSLANTTVRVTVKGDDIFFNDAKVIAKNLLTVNGVMHVVDKVITPTPASTAGGTSTGGQPSPTQGNAGRRLGLGRPYVVAAMILFGIFN